MAFIFVPIGLGMYVYVCAPKKQKKTDAMEIVVKARINEKKKHEKGKYTSIHFSVGVGM